jgi:DNA-binding MarR family transcriptional regulator
MTNTTRSFVDPRTEQFIERMGMLSEEDGLPRIAGRIFALLLITPGSCSLDEIAESLGVSKASVSTDTRRLAQAGLIERLSRPGERRDYYQIGPLGLRIALERRVRGLERFTELLTGAITLPLQSPEVETRLQQWLAVHNEVYDSFRVILTHVSEAPGTPQ